MKGIAPVSSKRFSFLAVAIVLALGLIASGAVAYMRLPYLLHDGKTRFAPGFSEFRFQQLAQGQSMESVIEALGRPLRQEILPPINAWVYVPLEHFAAKRLMPIPPSRIQYFTESTTVLFDESDRVTMTLGKLLQPPPRVGMAKDEVAARYGDYTYYVQRPTLIEHVYSEPAGSPVWKTRRVDYTQDHRLLATVGYTRFPDLRTIVSVNPFFPSGHGGTVDLLCYPQYWPNGNLKPVPFWYNAYVLDSTLSKGPKG
jgi:hypothetical protein